MILDHSAPAIRASFVAVLLLTATVDEARAQAFNGPATIVQPLTTNHCLKAQATGTNVVVDAGAVCGTGDALLGGNNVWTGTVRYTTLPTSDPHIAGQLWNNAGVLQVSGG